ncbi:hypothetical protein TURU_001943 [Turdus rufiventris]|nr:hypothetical protein TURU_001943 [Turdus rufiventris]
MSKPRRRDPGTGHERGKGGIVEFPWNFRGISVEFLSNFCRISVDIFTKEVDSFWDGIPRAAVAPSGSLEVSKARLELLGFQVPSKPNHSGIPWLAETTQTSFFLQ